MRKNSSRFIYRQFLNDPGYHSSGMIFAEVDSYGCPTLKISDCSRTITFGLDAPANMSTNQVVNMLKKLARVEDGVRGLREFLTKEAIRVGIKLPKSLQGAGDGQ